MSDLRRPPASCESELIAATTNGSECQRLRAELEKATSCALRLRSENLKLEMTCYQQGALIDTQRRLLEESIGRCPKCK